MRRHLTGTISCGFAGADERVFRSGSFRTSEMNWHSLEEKENTRVTNMDRELRLLTKGQVADVFFDLEILKIHYSFKPGIFIWSVFESQYQTSHCGWLEFQASAPVILSVVLLHGVLSQDIYWVPVFPPSERPDCHLPFHCTADAKAWAFGWLPVTSCTSLVLRFLVF